MLSEQFGKNLRKRHFYLHRSFFAGRKLKRAEGIHITAPLTQGSTKTQVRSGSGLDYISYNRPFSNCLVPPFHSEASCKTFHMKMSSICM